jgi:hypothetical protein
LNDKYLGALDTKLVDVGRAQMTQQQKNARIEGLRVKLFSEAKR